jgi:hypothetical protein
MGGDAVNPELRWSIGVCGFATALAVALVQVTLDLPWVDLLGWSAFLGLLQLPIIAKARRGELDPCTSWVRRFAREHAA